MRLDQRWMMTLMMFVLPLLVQGQQIADRKPGEFERVRIFGKMTVRMIPGSEPNVHIEAKDVSLEKIKSSIEDGELKVKLSRLFSSGAEVYVEITHGDLKGIEALADAEVIFDQPVVAPRFDIQSTMGSNVKLAIETQHLDLKAYQGGQVLIKGSADTLDSYVNTGGILSGTDLVCQRVDIRMNTGGKGEVTVERELEAAINTGSDFSYFGKPASTDISTSFGGTVSAWDEEE